MIYAISKDNTCFNSDRNWLGQYHVCLLFSVFLMENSQVYLCTYVKYFLLAISSPTFTKVFKKKVLFQPATCCKNLRKAFRVFTLILCLDMRNMKPLYQKITKNYVTEGVNIFNMYLIYFPIRSLETIKKYFFSTFKYFPLGGRVPKRLKPDAHAPKQFIWKLKKRLWSHDKGAWRVTRKVRTDLGIIEAPAPSSSVHFLNRTNRRTFIWPGNPEVASWKESSVWQVKEEITRAPGVLDLFRLPLLV